MFNFGALGSLTSLVFEKGVLRTDEKHLTVFMILMAPGSCCEKDTANCFVVSDVKNQSAVLPLSEKLREFSEKVIEDSVRDFISVKVLKTLHQKISNAILEGKSFEEFINSEESKSLINEIIEGIGASSENLDKDLKEATKEFLEKIKGEMDNEKSN